MVYKHVFADKGGGCLQLVKLIFEDAVLLHVQNLKVRDETIFGHFSALLIELGLFLGQLLQTLAQHFGERVIPA